MGGNKRALTRPPLLTVRTGHWDLVLAGTGTGPTGGGLGQNIYNDGFNQRWGNFSTTNVDPTDPYSFWTVQEYARPGGGTDWRTQITEITLNPSIQVQGPEPGSLILVVASLLAAVGRGRWHPRRALIRLPV